MSDGRDVEFEEKRVPSWVVQRAVSKALGGETVRGIDPRDDQTYAVMVEREENDADADSNTSETDD